MNYCLPQRRNRVWAIASVITRREKKSEIAETYQSCVESMKSNFQFPLDLNFPGHGQKAERPKKGRHEWHVEKALAQGFSRQDIFVDCNGSKKRPCVCFGGAPCITPSHPIWSVELSRYLGAVDLLNAQGLWESAYPPEAYAAMKEDPKFASSLAGNSFSSTVAQVVFLSSLVACAGSWQIAASHIEAADRQEQPRQEQPGQEQPRQEQPCPQAIFKRIRKKRKAPEFDSLKPDAVKPKKPKKRTLTQAYKRKKPGCNLDLHQAVFHVC